MADSHFDFAAAEGLLKPVFDKLRDARPNLNHRFTRKFGFDSSKKLGEVLRAGVWLTDEYGFTHNAGAGEAFDLLDSVAATSQKMEGNGSEIVLLSTVAVKALSAMAERGDKAFVSAYGSMLKNMRKSMDRRVEATSIWGQHADGIGIIQARTVDAGTSQTFSITYGNWAAGLFAGTENMLVDVWAAGFGTKRNTSGTMKITAITHEKNASNLATLKFLGTEAEMDNIVETDVIVFRGARDGSGGAEESIGMMKSSANTGSYLDIDGAVYSQWAGNTYDVAGNFTWDKLEDMISLGVGKGLDQDLICYVSPLTWSRLNVDLSALRVIDSSYSMEKTEAGTKSIRYHSQTGMVTIEPYVFMKGKNCLVFPDDQDRIGRYGSSDVSFEIPEAGGKYMKVLERKHGVEFRCFTDQLVVNRAVAHCVVGTGIVN